MLQDLVNYYWAHPVGVTVGIIAAILILIWMTGSGSRQRFITVKRTKETEQLARDLTRIANSLERIAKSYEMPPDYLGRPIPPGYEETIIKNHAHAQEGPPGRGLIEPGGEGPEPSSETNPDEAQRAPDASPSNSSANPLGGTASLLGDKKKLNLPNPLYRPK